MHNFLIQCYFFPFLSRNSISIPSLCVDAVCRRLIERFKDPLDSAVSCIKGTLVDAIKEKSSLVNILFITILELNIFPHLSVGRVDFDISENFLYPFFDIFACLSMMNSTITKSK